MTFRRVHGLRGSRKRGARGACVSHVCRELLIPPLCVFLHLTLPPPRLSPGGGCGRLQPPLVRRMEWRPPLLYAYPLGHRLLATLKIPEKPTEG